MAKKGVMKKKQFKNTCVFCHEERKLSEEHILPKWMIDEDIIPKIQDFHIADDHKYTKWGGLGDVDTRKKKQGSLGNKKRRIVCEVCNTGWMSKLQTKNKEVLTALIKGEQIDLDKYSTADLYCWIIMTSFMISFASNNRVMGRDEAKCFYQTWHLPRNPIIYLGRYEGPHRIRRKNVCGYVGEVAEGMEPSQNIQMISIILGKLFIQFCYCTEAHVQPYISQRFQPYVYLFFPPLDGPKIWLYERTIIRQDSFKLIAERMHIETVHPAFQEIVIATKIKDLYEKGD